MTTNGGIGGGSKGATPPPTGAACDLGCVQLSGDRHPDCFIFSTSLAYGVSEI